MLRRVPDTAVARWSDVVRVRAGGNPVLADTEPALGLGRRCRNGERKRDEEQSREADGYSSSSFSAAELMQ